MDSESSQTIRLVERAAAGDNEAREALFTCYRERLCRMVAVRLDRRAQARLDPSDVVQEACVEASCSLDDYLREPKMSFFLWLRAITGHKLLALMRRELGAEMRDARREVLLHPQTNSAILADQLMDSITGPSTAAVREELKARLQQAIDALDALDREVLALRHFEQLTNAEAAQVLGIQPAAARKRHIRALKRLKSVYSSFAADPLEL
jgi:RNA polymerase sigma-70 factor (ECF subfamily)